MLRPGVSPTASDWNALLSHLNDAFRQLQTAPGAYGSDTGVIAGSGGGFQTFNGRDPEHWARIGEGADGSYEHTQMVPDGAGGFTEMPATSEFIWGTTTEVPAREQNGREDVPAGAVVRLYRDYDGTGFIFTYLDDQATAAASSGSWLAGLESTDCLQLTVVSVSGKCSEIDPDQSIHLVWDAGDSRWEGTTDFVHDGGSGPVYFTDAAPALTIDGNSGRYLGADSEGLLFAFGKSPLCTEGTPATCNNSFVVRVKCGTCTELPGWDGPGWYCVKSPGDTGLGYRVELLEGDQYTDEIEIVSGPYATEALALEGCPSGGGTPDPVPTGCCTPPVARALTATVTTVGGAGCACLVGAWPLVWDGTSRWAGEIGAGCAAGWRFKIYCDGATWKRDDSPVATGSVGADSQSCSPLTITWTNLAFGGGGGEPCGGNVQVVVTEA